MKLNFAFGLIVAIGSSVQAQTVNVHGKVSNASGQPVANALVELANQKFKDTTGSDGSYSLTKPGVAIGPAQGAFTEGIRLDQGVLEFTLSQAAQVKVEVFDVKGELQNKDLLPKAQPGVYHLNITAPHNSNGLLIIRASIGRFVQTFRYFPMRKDVSEGTFTLARSGSTGGRLAKTAAAIDTLKISAVGFAPQKIALSVLDTTLNVSLVADATTVYKPCPTNGNPCKILPFGDSITMGDESTDRGGYRSRLYKLILAANQKVTFVGSRSDGPTQVSGQPFPRTHDGHPGWVIGEGSKGISSLLPSPALNAKPEIILLMIGTNDLFGGGTDAMATRLQTLVDKIVLNAPNSLIVLAQITPLPSRAAPLAAYNAKIPGIVQSNAAKGRHIIGVDMSKMPTNLLSDGTHPNDAGYAYVADIWYAAIKDLLPK
ncbi:MAG: GDSL-type esterase/lipase family protein [Fibrobacteria bacterium]